MPRILGRREKQSDGQPELTYDEQLAKQQLEVEEIRKEYANMTQEELRSEVLNSLAEAEYLLDYSPPRDIPYAQREAKMIYMYAAAIGSLIPTAPHEAVDDVSEISQREVPQKENPENY